MRDSQRGTIVERTGHTPGPNLNNNAIIVYPQDDEAYNEILGRLEDARDSGFGVEWRHAHITDA